MKIQPRSADSFVKNPDPSLRAILVYGSDQGLVREREKALGLSVVDRLDDPFRVIELSGDRIASDPAILNDEAAAISMMGGRRVVFVRDASDGASGVLSDYLKEEIGDALVVVTAGELSARSKLRKLFENSERGAAIACYPDEGADLDRLLTDILGSFRVRIDRDARSFVLDNLGGDRGMSRSEIEKLALYAGEGGTLGLEDATMLLGDSAALSLDDAIYAAIEGDSRALDIALDRAQEAGTNVVVMLRSLGSLFYRLRYVQDMVRDGKPMDATVQSLRPNVFYKVRPRFDAAVKRWAPDKLREALRLVLEAEAACKRTGAPDWLLCHRCFHQVASLGRQRAKA